MIELKLHQENQKLDNLFKFISNINDDPEIMSHWSKYLCVLVSGYIENSVRLILTNYISNKSSPCIANFVNNKIKHITNLKAENICQLLRSFNEDWANTFSVSITEEEKDSIDSVVSLRHIIAHGQSTGLSFSTINKYYTNVKNVIYKISTIVNNQW